MTHSCDIEELLTAYLDGELLPGELDIVVSKLQDCRECIGQFHELKETRAALRALPLLKVPETLIPDGHFEVQLSAYLDGELPTTEYDLVFGHLQDCSRCRVDLHELDAARTAVRSLPRLEPPELLAVERARRLRGLPTGRRVAMAAAGIAAAALLVVGVRTTSDEPVTAVDLDSFADRHVARASVEPGFQVIPALNSGGTP